MKNFLIICICCLLPVRFSLAAPETVFLSDLEEFSGMSKEMILLKRQVAVETSPLFALLEETYAPSSEVFQLQDKAPWIGAYEISCHGATGNRNIAKGLSRESLGILNPELLLHLEVLSYKFADKGNGCSPVDYLLPYEVTFDHDKKLIVARINYSAFLKKNKSFYNASLMDANAHDLGYNYIFAKIPESKSFFWKNADNVTTSVIRTKGYYHLGKNVCREIGGCNNYSPAQPAYDFYIRDLPAEIHFKLWKDMPSSTAAEPDLSYHLIFE